MRLFGLSIVAMVVCLLLGQRFSYFFDAQPRPVAVAPLPSSVPVGKPPSVLAINSLPAAPTAEPQGVVKAPANVSEDEPEAFRIIAPGQVLMPAALAAELENSGSAGFGEGADSSLRQWFDSLPPEAYTTEW